MASSFFTVDFKGCSAVSPENPKPSVMATSPQSTLCGIGSWSFSSNGSPDGPSQVSSPPSTPFQQPTDDALDLLCAAAGQVVRLGLNDENVRGRGLLAPPKKPSPTRNQMMGCLQPSQALIQQQLQAVQFNQLKRQQLMKKQQHSSAWGRQNRSKSVGGSYGERPTTVPLGLANSAWPPLQKQQSQQQSLSNQPGSGMRAVFLHGSGPRKQSAGTGVFIPRRTGTPNEPRKKPACATVLLPARVVQALNLNLDDLGAYPRLPSGYVLEPDAVTARNGNRSPVYSQPGPAPSLEIHLPSEWTY